MNLKIIPVSKCDEDGKLIMNWRNNVVTRKMFYNNKIKVWDTFKKEFYDYYFKNIPLFAVIDNKKISFVSFVKEVDGVYSISINIPPENRGKKLASLILKKSLEYIKNNYKNITKIVAEIKVENLPSIKSFLRAGFIFEKDDTKKINNDILKIKVYSYYL